MADQLRGEMEKLIEKQHKAEDARWQCYEDYKKFKA